MICEYKIDAIYHSQTFFYEFVIGMCLEFQRFGILSNRLPSKGNMELVKTQTS